MYSTSCTLCSCGCVHVYSYEHEGKKSVKSGLDEKGCLLTVFEIQPYTAIDSAAGCNVLPLLSGKFLLWRSMKCVYVREAERVCVHDTHMRERKREREERRRAIRGGWAIVQTACEGLVGGKAAFVRSQPPQQLPATWRTSWEKIHPAYTKFIKKDCVLKEEQPSSHSHHLLHTYKLNYTLSQNGPFTASWIISFIHMQVLPVKVKRVHWQIPLILLVTHDIDLVAVRQKRWD